MPAVHQSSAPPLSVAPWPRYRAYYARVPCYINPGATICPALCQPLPEEVLALEHRKSCIVEQKSVILESLPSLQGEKKYHWEMPV